MPRPRTFPARVGDRRAGSILTATCSFSEALDTALTAPAYRLLERHLGISTQHRPVDLVEGLGRRRSTRKLQLLPAQLREQRGGRAPRCGSLGARPLWVCLRVRRRRLRCYVRRSLRPAERRRPLLAVPNAIVLGPGAFGVATAKRGNDEGLVTSISLSGRVLTRPTFFESRTSKR